ncbi:MAG: DUF934 domain-containing protein [Pseudomonadota bacterium]
MTVVVTDAGFGGDASCFSFVSLDEARPDDPALHLAPDTDPERLPAIAQRAKAIRIAFPSFADGRGLTLARRLRMIGYSGHLRAKGYVLADQYAMIRRAGFDDVEIDDGLATRQPEDQWRVRADWRANDYQSRLRGTLKG